MYLMKINFTLGSQGNDFYNQKEGNHYFSEKLERFSIIREDNSNITKVRTDDEFRLYEAWLRLGQDWLSLGETAITRLLLALTYT